MFADDSIKLNGNVKQFFIRLENTVEKGKKNECFQKTHTNKGMLWKGLTLYHTILTFNDPEKEAF